MKIVHLLGWFFPDSIGGTEVYVDALCGRLQASGYDVRIAAPIARADGGPSVYRHGGVPVFRYPIPASPSRDEAYQRRPVRGADALYRWLAEEHPDVLHIHSFTTGVGLPSCVKRSAWACARWRRVTSPESGTCAAPAS